MRYSSDSPEVQKFLHLWHEAGREGFQRSYPNLDYDSPGYRKSATDRKKYVALDSGTSGAYLLDRETGELFGIKGYGVPHLGRRYGTLEQVADNIRTSYHWRG